MGTATGSNWSAPHSSTFLFLSSKHRMILPGPTVTSWLALVGSGVAGAAVGAPLGAAAALAVGSVVAGASTAGFASPGTFGPICTPARRGQAMPITNPATPMMPTRDQAGCSSAGRGISTLSGRSFFDIGSSPITNAAALRNSPRFAGSTRNLGAARPQAAVRRRHEVDPVRSC